MMANCGRRTAVLVLLAAAVVGCGQREAAPQFNYTLLNGTQAHSDDLRGQVVLVNFWATSCAVCVAEMPQIVATHQQFSARGLRTLAVAMRYDAPASVAHYAETHKLPFGVVIDNTGDIASRFGNVDATPTTFVIDKQGAIAQRIVGAPDFVALQALIDRLLREA